MKWYGICKGSIEKREDKQQVLEKFFTSYIKTIRQYGKECGLNEKTLDFLVYDIMNAVAGECKNLLNNKEPEILYKHLKHVLRVKAAEFLRIYCMKSDYFPHCRQRKYPDNR